MASTEERRVYALLIGSVLVGIGAYVLVKAASEPAPSYDEYDCIPEEVPTDD